MSIKIKMLKNLISVLCAATIATSGVVTSVSAAKTTGNTSSTSKTKKEEVKQIANKFASASYGFTMWAMGIHLDRKSPIYKTINDVYRAYADLGNNFDNAEKVNKYKTLVTESIQELEEFKKNYKKEEVKQTSNELAKTNEKLDKDPQKEKQAEKIQANWRGYNVRKGVKKIKVIGQALSKPFERIGMDAMKANDQEIISAKNATISKFTDTLSKASKRIGMQIGMNEMKEAALKEKQAAEKIQAAWKGYKYRNDAKKAKLEKAVEEIQAAWKGYKYRNDAKKAKLNNRKTRDLVEIRNLFNQTMNEINEDNNARKQREEEKRQKLEQHKRELEKQFEERHKEFEELHSESENAVKDFVLWLEKNDIDQLSCGDEIMLVRNAYITLSARLKVAKTLLECNQIVKIYKDSVESEISNMEEFKNNCFNNVAVEQYAEKFNQYNNKYAEVKSLLDKADSAIKNSQEEEVKRVSNKVIAEQAAIQSDLGRIQKEIDVKRVKELLVILDEATNKLNDIENILKSWSLI